MMARLSWAALGAAVLVGWLAHPVHPTVELRFTHPATVTCAAGTYLEADHCWPTTGP